MNTENPINKTKGLTPTPQEEKLKGTTVRFHGKSYEFSHIQGGYEYFIRIEWKKGVKNYIDQYVKRPTKK